jgi:hypothetical protein
LDDLFLVIFMLPIPVVAPSENLAGILTGKIRGVVGKRFFLMKSSPWLVAIVYNQVLKQ